MVNLTTNAMFGIFEAISPVVFKMEPMAWTKGVLPETPLPAQVRFRVILEAPISEDGDTEVRIVHYS
jgi:hypothetical protein